MQPLPWAMFGVSRCETNGLRRAAAQLVTDLLDCAALLLSPASTTLCSKLYLMYIWISGSSDDTGGMKQALGATPHTG